MRSLERAVLFPCLWALHRSVFLTLKKSPHCTNELTHHAGLFVALFREDLELDLLLQRLGKLKALSNLLSELKSRVF